METKIIQCAQGNIREQFYCLSPEIFLNTNRVYLRYRSLWKRLSRADTFEITCFEKHKHFFNVYAAGYKAGIKPMIQLQMNRTDVRLIFRESEVVALFTTPIEKQAILDTFELCYRGVTKTAIVTRV
jgi:hypothetical protein